MSFKPIETEYNGYKFRSRLEARWAVFFDSLKIKYEYEPEGFEFGDGTRYLPDFYLPEFDLYVEIKPFDQSVVRHVGDGNEWEEKCRSFRDETGHSILLCYSDPASDSFKRLFAYFLCDSGGGSLEWNCLFTEFDDTVVICTEPVRKDMSIYTLSTFEDRTDRLGTPAEFAKDKNLLWERAMRDEYDPHSKTKLNVAKTKARQARFEYGEKPFQETE